MRRQIVVGLAAGAAFLVLDGAINANPLAQRLYTAYQPIARPGINVVAGSAIDLAFGVILAGLFSALRGSLPGGNGLTKGLSFGLIVWFLRVCMRVASEWVVTVVPAEVHAYTLAAGFVQILVVTGVIGWLLQESPETGAARPGRDSGA